MLVSLKLFTFCGYFKITTLYQPKMFFFSKFFKIKKFIWLFVQGLKSRQDLVRHVQYVHSDARPFACDKCPKRFKRKADLGIHEQSHNTILSFSCEVNKSLSLMGAYTTIPHTSKSPGKTPSNVWKYIYVCLRFYFPPTLPKIAFVFL